MVQLSDNKKHLVFEASDLLAEFFRGLGDPTRIKILEFLMGSDKNVTELVDMLDLTQGGVSSHLIRLRWSGYVDSYRVGKYMYYRLADPRVRALLDLAQNMLSESKDSESESESYTSESGRVGIRI